MPVYSKAGKNMKRIEQNFYDLDALTAAPLLLGKILCRKIDNKTVKTKITETECYMGEEDTACHASKGKTSRTKTLYERGGKVYVYLCYGIHYMLNIVTGTKDIPQAVLIRGIENHDGPGKLSKYLRIDKNLNEENLITSDKIWIEDNELVHSFTASPRIGIDYATEEYKNKLWRFKIN